MTLPMLVDFAARLSCGLAVALLGTSRREVPAAFFRTLCLVILGLMTAAALVWFTTAGAAATAADQIGEALVIATAALAFLASACWGLGLTRQALPLTGLMAAATGGLLVVDSAGPVASLEVVNAAGRLASAVLLGSTLTAMLLGHHYLTAPAMSIDPLRRLVRAMAWALGARALLAAVGLAIWTGELHSAVEVPSLFLAIRWGMGLAGPALATVLAWKTVQLRSTQSATGILYIAMTLVLFGELTALILERRAGIIF